MTTKPMTTTRVPRGRRLRAPAALAAGVLALTGSLALAPAALAQRAGTGTGAVVVKVVTRSPVGKMLATPTGRSLYTDSSTCTSSCLTIWPPLVLPTGKTVPKGIRGLGTVALTVNGQQRLQVTYSGKPLYKFSGDTGTSLNGNGLGGFSAATVT
jgi:predicted lipoprotein with Yx(FWY)xxD motif